MTDEREKARETAFQEWRDRENNRYRQDLHTPFKDGFDAGYEAGQEARGWVAINDDLIEILGRPNFTCGHIANAMRQTGVEIPRKAEAEQAYVLHWLLGHYFTAGTDWKKTANADVEKWLEPEVKP